MLRRILVVMVVLTATARADDDPCSKPLPHDVREVLAVAYSCGVHGVRCYDGQVGRAFQSSKGDKSPDAGYFPGEALYELVGAGESATIHVFATTACADSRLTNLKFTPTNVKERNSTLESPPAPQSNAKADAAKQASAKIQQTQEAVNSQAASAKTARDHADQLGKSLDSTKLCAAKATSCQESVNKLKDALKDPKALTQLDLSTKFQAFDQTHADEIGKLKDQLAHDQTQVQTANDNVKKEIESLHAVLDASPALDKTTRNELTAPLKNLADQPIDKIQQTLADTRDKAEAAATAAGAPVSTWKSFRADSAEVSVRTDFEAIPTDADVGSVEIQITNENTIKVDDKTTKTQAIWPGTTLSIRVDHGRYFLDYGFMFAAVAGADRINDNGKAACPDQCRWGHQPMLVVNAFIFGGRDKSILYNRRNWYPGLQLGLNADLSKISDAISAGIVFEPLSGISISGGMMFKARVLDPRATPAADGSLPMEHRFLPFIGIAINSDVYDAIKSTGDKGGKASDPKN